MMTARTVFCIVAACISLAACSKPAAKFQPGERVVVRVNRAKQAIVLVRLKPFSEDLYYLKVPGRPSDSDRELSSEMAWLRASMDEKLWHAEGPYYETDLEAAR